MLIAFGLTTTASLPIASATVAAPAPTWQAIAAMAEDASQSAQYDPALAWLSARGPIRRTITSADDVDAMLSLTQAWAARGGKRLQSGDVQGGLADLSAILQHGAAIERHAHTLNARHTGAQMQDLALQILEIAALQDLSSSERAAILMVLGEAAVVPSAAESTRRQCTLDAAAIQRRAYWKDLSTVQALLIVPEETAQRLLAHCAQETPPDSSLRNRGGVRLAASLAMARSAEEDALLTILQKNAARRDAFREQLGRR